MEELNKFKASSDFWKDFVLQPDWQVHLKKNYKVEVIIAEFGKLPELDTAIAKVQKETKRLVNMRNASMGLD